MFAQPKREHHTRSNIVLEYARDYGTGVRVVRFSVSTSRPRCADGKYTAIHSWGYTRVYCSGAKLSVCQY